jgi:hypothetical protein
MRASEGLANDVGDADIYHPAGSVLWPGETSFADLALKQICGNYVRILREDPEGTIEDVETDKTYTAIWWGVICSRTWQPNNDQTGLDAHYSCKGLLGVLDQIVPFHHWEINSDSSAAADITLPLVFNDKKKGNMSEATFTLAGRTVHIFDRRSGKLWTAKDAVEYLLAVTLASNTGGPQWTLGGSLVEDDGLLDFSEKWDISGMSTLEAITRIINPRQSRGYRLEMGEDFQPIIYAMSLSGSDITVGSLTLPGSDDTTPLDLTTSSVIIDYDAQEEQLATYGRVGIVGGDDIYIMTLKCKVDDSGQIVRDWIDAEREAWAIIDDEDELKSGELSKVNRRFKIRADWDGSNHNGSYLISSVREVSLGGDPETTLHGDGGYTGVLAGIDTLINGNNFALTKDLPLPVDKNWDTQDPATADFTTKPTEIQVFVKIGDEWQTLAEYAGYDSIQIETDEDQSSITLGPPDIANFVDDILMAGNELYFTIGVKHQLPLMVSWIGDDLEPVDQSRSIIKLRPHTSRKTIVQDTIFRISDGAAQSRVATTETESDLPELLQCLALATAWYGQPEWALSWEDIGIITTDLGKPGRLYTSFKYFYKPGSTSTISMNAVVTRREWDFSDANGRTKMITKRIKHDIETVF